MALKEKAIEEGPQPGEAPISPPRLPRFLVGVLTPRDLERDVIDDFDEFYREWVVPKYGTWAALWAWMQVPKTLAAIIRDTLMDFWTRRNNKAD